MLELPEEPITIVYTNHRAETAPRRVLPIKIWFGKTIYHPESQWFLRAWDIERNVLRDFAMLDIQKWCTT